MGDLSKNFSRSEFACKCGCGFNTVDVRLLASIQELRDIIGKPVNINSGCRCESWNKEIGGTINSQHTKAKAADIWVDGMSTTEVFGYAESVRDFYFGGIGKYDTFLHVDVRDTGAARWNFGGTT